MSLEIDLLRPADLLNLRIEAVNLRLDATHPAAPSLVVDEAGQPAWLIVTFPPQTIAENAFAEASGLVEAVPPPGQPRPGSGVVALIATRSRLVFDVPAGVRIPFTTEGLLDWTRLRLRVNPIAAIGRAPTPEQLANAPAIAPPAPDETALELPYRVILSPTREVLWAHRSRPFSAHGRTELWHTRLQLGTPGAPLELSQQNRAPLRAIWSPDYDPYTPTPSSPQDAEMTLALTAMSPDHRSQVVALTSAFHGYEEERKSHIAPRPNLPDLLPDVRWRTDAAVEPARARASAEAAVLSSMVPYTPRPLEVELLMLSPLGGWLRSRGQWPETHPEPRHQDPRSARREGSPMRPLLPGDGRLATVADMRHIVDDAIRSPRFFDRQMRQLGVAGWAHVAAQGRDHYVRIEEYGVLLWPVIPATFVTETQRKFIERNGVVGAYLLQRRYIVVRDPMRWYTDRCNPFRSVRLTTTVTPDLTLGPPIAGSTNSFWVEVGDPGQPAARTKFPFHAVGTDAEGGLVDFTAPMLFVNQVDLANSTIQEAIIREYNKFENLEHRDCRIPGQRVAFAERDRQRPNDNTQLVTEVLNFVVGPGKLEPRMLAAQVRIPQVEELLGVPTATTIRYARDYVEAGFDAAAGVFAEIAQLPPDPGRATDALSADLPDPFDALQEAKLPVRFSADKAGGIATPDMDISMLTRELGPLAGTVEDARQGRFNLSDFFPKDMAKLFGSFDLADLIPPTSQSLDKNAPKLRTTTSEVPGGKRVTTTLDWEPEIKPIPGSVASLEIDRGANSRLVIHARIEKPVTLATPGAQLASDLKYEFSGRMNDFRVGLLESVFVNFTEFRFLSGTNRKTEVTVELDRTNPVEFAGDLAFVEDLRKAIPPGLFGKGTGVDVRKDSVRAGFTVSLPSIAVGVFALRNLSLGAALTLPFLDGKPLFEFNFALPASPFLLAVGFFGGSGYFVLKIDTAGMRELQASLEFGATLALDIGIASGEVHAMAGIYFSLQRKSDDKDPTCVLSGFLRLGGSLSVLGLIHISLEFNLSFTYDQDRDKAWGRATLTVMVEVLFFSKSVELTVERAFGGHGDPKFSQMMPTTRAWRRYALAFA